MTIPVDMRYATSDHFMVHADLNAGAPYCHPQIARDVVLKDYADASGAPVRKDEIDGTAIGFPGAMQWFRVSHGGPGAWSIEHRASSIRTKMC